MRRRVLVGWPRRGTLAAPARCGGGQHLGQVHEPGQRLGAVLLEVLDLSIVPDDLPCPLRRLHGLPQRDRDGPPMGGADPRQICLPPLGGCLCRPPGGAVVPSGAAPVAMTARAAVSLVIAAAIRVCTAFTGPSSAA